MSDPAKPASMVGCTMPHGGVVGIRGTVYMDGGYDISNATGQGVELHQSGVSYVCPHGVCCADIATREEDCVGCSEAKAYESHGVISE